MSDEVMGRENRRYYGDAARYALLARQLYVGLDEVPALLLLEFPDLDLRDIGRLNKSLEIELMSYIVDFKRGGAVRQTALEDAGERRRELDAAIANPETDAASLPVWAVMRKALGHLPPADPQGDASQRPDYPPIVTTRSAVLVAHGRGMKSHSSFRTVAKQEKFRYENVSKRAINVWYEDREKHTRLAERLRSPT